MLIEKYYNNPSGLISFSHSKDDIFMRWISTCMNSMKFTFSYQEMLIT